MATGGHKFEACWMGLVPGLVVWVAGCGWPDTIDTRRSVPSTERPTRPARPPVTPSRSQVGRVVGPISRPGEPHLPESLVVAVERMVDQLAYCNDRALRRDPALDEDIAFTIRLVPNYRSTAWRLSRMVEPITNNAPAHLDELATCVERRLREWRVDGWGSGVSEHVLVFGFRHGPEPKSTGRDPTRGEEVPAPRPTRLGWPVPSNPPPLFPVSLFMVGHPSNRLTPSAIASAFREDQAMVAHCAMGLPKSARDRSPLRVVLRMRVLDDGAVGDTPRRLEVDVEHADVDHPVFSECLVEVAEGWRFEEHDLPIGTYALGISFDRLAGDPFGAEGACDLP